MLSSQRGRGNHGDHRHYRRAGLRWRAGHRDAHGRARRRQIAAVGGPVLPGATVVDAAEGTLLPGLIDSHVHTDPDWLRLALRFGITTELEMMGHWTPEERAAIAGDDVGGSEVCRDGDYPRRAAIRVSTVPLGRRLPRTVRRPASPSRSAPPSWRGGGDDDRAAARRGLRLRQDHDRGRYRRRPPRADSHQRRRPHRCRAGGAPPRQAGHRPRHHHRRRAGGRCEPHVDGLGTHVGRRPGCPRHRGGHRQGQDVRDPDPDRPVLRHRPPRLLGFLPPTSG